MSKIDLVYDVHEKPRKLEWLILSLQHVLAMFGATVLVPALTGLNVGITLICAGLGTLIYIACTKGKSPVFLGSSFAFITPMLMVLTLGTALNAAGVDQFINGQYTNFAEKVTDLGLLMSDLNYIAVSIGIMSVGAVYVIVAGIIRIAGVNWLHKVLPPVVIGPTIMVIGLSMAPTAVGMAQGNGSWQNMLVALVTLLTAVLVSCYAKGFSKLIPVMIGIIVGYITAVIVGLVDFTPVKEAAWFEFAKPAWFNKEARQVFDWSQVWTILTIMVPVSLVTISEHMGDHLVLSQMIGKDLTKNPGLSRTLLGDGLATLLAGALGGPANTTYGENTGVVGITRVASVWVLGGAAVIAILFGFCGKFSALISTIPGPVMGGVSLMLFGIIAASGLRLVINNGIDLGNQRNLIITSVILVAGIGGFTLTLGPISIANQALAIIIGIVLHQMLPDKKAGYGNLNDDLNPSK